METEKSRKDKNVIIAEIVNYSLIFLFYSSLIFWYFFGVIYAALVIMFSIGWGLLFSGIWERFTGIYMPFSPKDKNGYAIEHSIFKKKKEIKLTPYIIFEIILGPLLIMASVAIFIYIVVK